MRGDAQVFSGGEQDSFSFDLGTLEEKIHAGGIEHWYCNFDTPQRDRVEVEEENDEIKQILGNVIGVVDPDHPEPPPSMQPPEERPEILSFLDGPQRDESVDFETRERLALELVQNEETKAVTMDAAEPGERVADSPPARMKRRNLTIEDPYMSSEPSYKNKPLAEEEELAQYRTYSPGQRRSLTPVMSSKIPSLRQQEKQQVHGSVTPRASLPSLFDSRKSPSPLTRNQFGFRA